MTSMSGGRRWDREILRLAVPALGALVAEPLYVLVDLAIVGRLGTPELAGVGVASTVLLTGYSLFIFLAYGTTSKVARLLGAGRRADAAAQGVQALWLGTAIGVALAVIGWAVADWTIDAMGATGAVATHALSYFEISMLGVPALTIVLAGTGYLRGLQDTRTPLVVAATTAGANVALELWFVFGLDLGVAGSAWSTVLVQWAAALTYITVIARDVRRTQVSVLPDVRALRSLARVSVDLLVRTAALRASLVVATAVATRIGVVEVAAHQVVFEIWSFLALALDSIAIAAQSMIGRLLGEGDAEPVRSASRRMLQWGAAAGAVFCVVLLAARSALPWAFTGDDDVAGLASFLLLHAAVLQPLSGLVFTLDGILIGAGDLRFLAKAMVGAALVFIPAALSVLVLDLGVAWLWGSIGLLQLARFAALFARWRSDRWVVTGPGDARLGAAVDDAV